MSEELDEIRLKIKRLETSVKILSKEVFKNTPSPLMTEEQRRIMKGKFKIEPKKIAKI